MHVTEKNAENIAPNGSVSAEELAQEILPLLEDYFIGDFSSEGGAITYRLPDGQTFVIAVAKTRAA